VAPISGRQAQEHVEFVFRGATPNSLYGTTYADLLNSPDPLSSTGTSGFLLLTGSNPNLKPEKSSQWTAGVDLAPLAAQWFELGLSYYDIHFRDRIAPPGFPVFTALDQGDLYAPFIMRNPSSSLVAQLTSPPYVFDNATVLPFPGYGPPRTLADVVAVANDTYQNIASTDTNGADITANLNLLDGAWRYNVALDATYVFQYRETAVPGSASLSPLSTLGNPLNFRGRAIFSATRGPLGGNVAINYDNHYEDTSVPSSPIAVASWTTVDVQARYQIPRIPVSPLAHAGLTIALSCVNCLNRPPPFVLPADSYEGVGYDAANANPLGRLMSLSVEVKW
jgi:iron complex outermembrane receptor protein